MGLVSEPEVTLLTFHHSAYAQRAVVALEEKGISYKTIDVDFKNKPQLLLESNPMYKKVPVIIHKGKPVVESLVILQYLEDAFPEKIPLMPKDAFEKSKIRFWADYMYKIWDKFLDAIRSQYGSPQLQSAQGEVVTILKTLEAAMTSYSTEGPWFTGETFGFLDVVLVPLENTLMMDEKLGGVEIPGPDEIPRIHKWIQAMSERPSYRSLVPSKEEVLPYFRAIFERRAAALAAAASK